MTILGSENMPVHIPSKLAAVCQNNEERLRWLQALPEVLQDLQQR